MNRFCTKCGTALDENGKCANCDAPAKVEQEPTKITEQLDFLETDKQIIPDCVSPDAGETPIKQYKLAKLRSKIRGQYAEGRLQITNKRLIFRAAGVSTLGKTLTQQEISVDGIAGIDVKQSNRVSGLNVFFAALIGFILNYGLQTPFRELLDSNEVLAYTLAYLLSAVAAFILFVIPKCYWIKFASLSCSIGAVLGLSGKTKSIVEIFTKTNDLTFNNIVAVVIAIGWVYALVRVCLVPELIFAVKTKGAAEAIQIRRRVRGTVYRQPQEYSGFSEVLPWDDASIVAVELGAIIGDLQTVGDMAIEKWRV